MAARIPHPLSGLSIAEVNQARDVVLSLHPGSVIDFRAIYLYEPMKSEVLQFLDLEHSGLITEDTPRPARLAQARYDVIGGSKVPSYQESIINLRTSQRVKHEIVGSQHQPGLTV